jgi:hypothetical protein
MTPNDYYPVLPPEGTLIRNGFFYHPLSPLDEKLGTNRPALILRSSNGMSLELARSQRSLEWQRYCLSRTHQQAAEFRDEVVSMWDAGFRREDTGLTLQGLLELAGQFSILKKAFIEDERKVRLTSEEEAQLRIDTSGLERATQQEIVFDPHEHIADLITRPRNFSSDEMMHDHREMRRFGHRRWDYDSERGERLIPQLLKGHLLPLAYRLRNSASLAGEGLESVPGLEGDLLSWIMRAYGGERTILYHSDSRQEPWKVLLPSQEGDGKAPDLTLDDGESRQGYRTAIAFSDLEMRLALRLVTEAANISSVPVKTLMATERSVLASMLPYSLHSGTLQLEERPGREIQLTAAVKFRPYAVVDVEHPSNLLLMRAGECDISVRVSSLGKGQFVDYKLYEEDKSKPYDHFFSHGGNHVCGFHAVGASNWLPFSNAVWENYRLVHAILTNGLKYTYNSLDGIRRKCRENTLAIGETTLPRYLPRTAIEEHNRAQKPEQQIFIGDGCIN